MNYKKILTLFTLVLVAILIFGCNKNDTSKKDNISDDDSTEIIDSNGIFTENDKKTSYEESKCIIVSVDNDSITSTSSKVSIQKNKLIIQEAGTYIISGELSDGQIIVDASKDEKIRLILRNLSLNSNSSAALYVKKADNVFVTLDNDSVNYLTNNGEFINFDENNIDAAIFSKEDITFNGTGELNISTQYGHGIVSKDDLRIVGGIYNINTKKHGLVGKDAVKIASGTFNITSGIDGIHSENTDDEKLGYTYIENGKFTINSQGDGVDSNYILQINDGNFDITSVQKGLKSTNNINIDNGEFIIDANDDAIHSNANVKIKNGTFNCQTKDDGFHADSKLTVIDGNIIITQSYEGLESETIVIKGGVISIASTDDGINASGGNDSSGFGGPSFGGPGQDRFNKNSSSNSSIEIMGGKIYINAQGDGIDSNGSIYVSGGELYISGPTSNGDSAIDYDGTATITGGIVVAAGSKGMIQNFGTASTQGSILMTYTTKIQDAISLYDENNSLLITYTPTKSYDSVVISCPGLVKGKSYKLTAGTQTTTITLTSLIYGQGGQRRP